MPKNFARFVFGITIVFFCAFFLWPVLQILKGGFIDADGKLTFAYLTSLLSDRLYLGALANSFSLAFTTTLFALLIALPLAFITDRFVFPGKGFLGSIILVPMILPPFVGAIGIKQILGQYGALNALIIDLGLRPHGWTFDWLGANQFLGIAHLGVYRLGRGADFRLREGYVRSDFLRPERHWRKSLSLCLGRGHAREFGAVLRRRQRPVRARFLRHDGESHFLGRREIPPTVARVVLYVVFWDHHFYRRASPPRRGVGGVFE